MLLLWPLLLATTATGKEPAPTDSLKTNTVLYKLTHPDYQTVSYLFGTHHAFGKPFFDSLKFAKKALLSSDILIKENLNIPGHTASDIINSRTAETHWLKYLSKADYQFVNNIFSPGDMDLNKMTPAELFAFLGRYYKQTVCLRRDPADGYTSLDDYIGSLAEAHRIETAGLETTGEQIRLINQDIQGMPRKVHKKRLSGVIARIRSGQNNHCSELDWYSSMNFDLKIDQPCRNALMLTDRNNKWMEQLTGYLKTNNCFIAVGLSHLMFECGLLQQLSGLGFVITPVKVK